jgi:hypothetical protein
MDVIDGATAFACCVIAVTFWRSWMATRDRLFAIFAVAFFVFAINRVVLTVLDENNEGRTIVYLVRFLAFALIAVAILDKNRASRQPEPDRERAPRRDARSTADPTAGHR